MVLPDDFDAEYEKMMQEAAEQAAIIIARIESGEVRLETYEDPNEPDVLMWRLVKNTTKGGEDENS